VCLLSRFSRDWRKEDALIPIPGTGSGEVSTVILIVEKSAEAIVGLRNELS